MKIWNKILQPKNVHYFLIIKFFKILYLIMIGNNFSYGFDGSGPISGQTPCCIDKLTTITCQRQKQLNPALFLHKCMQNSDYAFIQCCHSCFDQNTDDSYNLSYKKTAQFLLTDPITAQCSDRRGEKWCYNFTNKKLNLTNPSKTRLDCSNVVIAFRLCRKSCGYCATENIPVQAVYNYKVAKNGYRCKNPLKGLAQNKSNIKLTYQNFINRFTKATNENENEMFENRQNDKSKRRSKPKFSKEIIENERHLSNDYFVVTDHDYKNYEISD